MKDLKDLVIYPPHSLEQLQGTQSTIPEELSSLFTGVRAFLGPVIGIHPCTPLFHMLEMHSLIIPTHLFLRHSINLKLRIVAVRELV